MASMWKDLLVYCSISIWIGALFATTSSLFVAMFFLPNPLSITWLVLMAASLALPLDVPTPGWAQALVRFSVRHAAEYHSLSLVIEDTHALKTGRPYVIGYEPHSALPTALPLVFCEHSELAPPALRSVKTLATSACFYCPVVRHLWWWLGGRPASAATMHALLNKGSCVLVCPGGVRECLHMEKGREAILLHGRTGFVRIAMQHGAPLLPVFVFGQTDAYSWVKMGPPVLPQWLTQRIARMIGFLPLFMYGMYGSPLPHPVHITTVIGTPIEVPQRDAPSKEEVQHWLDVFIQAMAALFEQHKAAAGYPDLKLLIV